MLLMTDIHVRSFTGSGIKPYVHSIAKLRMEIFREYPYFEEPHLERELQYLNMVCSCKEAISVLIFDGTTLVGVSLGLPLSIEEPAVLLPFKDKHIDTDSYFFFGDSALLKQYRGRESAIISSMRGKRMSSSSKNTNTFVFASPSPMRRMNLKITSLSMTFGANAATFIIPT